MTLLIIFHVLVCTFLVFVILLQPGKADAGIGFGSSSQSIFGSKGAGNFLTKTTSVCAVIFIFTSFILTRSRILEYDRSVIRNNPSGTTGDPLKDSAVPGRAEAPKPGERPSTPGAAAAVPNGRQALPPSTDTNATKGTPPSAHPVPQPVNPTTNTAPLPKHSKR